MCLRELTRPPHLAEADLRFKALARAVSVQIHKINANVSAITKLVDLLGTPKDTPDLRHKLYVRTSNGLRSIAECVFCPVTTSPMRRARFSKTQRPRSKVLPTGISRQQTFVPVLLAVAFLEVGC
jgi:hypothetical protein